ncbi:YceI family protein [bacterium]|nr:YceI family protein [bacterium]
MKKVLNAALISMALFSAIASAKDKPSAGRYQVDPMHSKIGFEVPHLVISSVEGSFKSFEGQIQIADNFIKSKVSASADVASVDTGVSKRDEHLKSPDFFDAQKHPKMTFDSTSISGTPDAFKLEGDLTIRGIKKKVVFDGAYLGSVTDGYGNRKIAFKARTKINRKDFGLVWNMMVEAGPTVGDEVTIVLNLQAAAANGQAKK